MGGQQRRVGSQVQEPLALFWDDAEYLATHGFSEYIKWQSVDALQVVAAFLTLAAVIPIYRRRGLAYAAFVAITVALPLSIGGFLSMGRVTSVLFPMFIWLGSAIGPDLRMSVVAASAMLQALCALGFFTWRSPY
jgi:hypothetical protein